MSAKENQLRDLALDAAREKGAVYPTFGESSDSKPVILDTDSGKCYAVSVTVREIR